MNNFLRKHSGKLKTMALILMLLIPFLLYAAALHDSVFQLKLFLALMTGNMLFLLKKG